MNSSTNCEVIRDEIQKLTHIKVDRKDRARCIWSARNYNKCDLLLPVSKI